MGRQRRSANQRYHDRVASRYESIYDDAYWKWHDAVTWEHLKRFLPRDVNRPAIDLGCGSGKWGRKLQKSGYHVTYSDLSGKMLDEARKQAELAGQLDKAAFVQADLMDLSALPENHYALATAMGEPIGLAASPRQALCQIARCLAPDGVLVGSVDNRIACIDYYLDKQDTTALEKFLKTGRTRWLTRDPSEQFEIHTFEPGQLRKLLNAAGLELVDLIGKTVLPLRRYRDLLEDATTRRRLARMEQALSRDPANFARCAHLQFAAKKQGL